ncbi:MAG: iron chelate uptake ABC transporter family permease subunit, partial [Candidatus Aenigmatarchaeota archaeon]
MFTRAYLFRTVLFLMLILLTISFLSLCAGSRPISPIKVFECLLNYQSQDVINEIIFKIRLPRVLLGIIIGAGLSVSGILFQSLLRNPLADPYLLGISSGAAFGIIVGLMTGVVMKTSMGQPLFSFMGAMLTVLIIYLIATISGR